MSHQRPLSEQEDIYDDSQNLLDLVTDGGSDDELWYETQLKAALEESLTSAEAGGVPQGRPGVQTSPDEEVVSQLQLEEVLWASQLEGLQNEQLQQVERISADSGLCEDMGEDQSSSSSDDEKSEELKQVLQLQATGPKRQVVSRRRERQKQRQSSRSAPDCSEDGATFLDEDSVNPELAQVLRGKQCSSASDLQCGRDEDISVEPCLVPSPLNDNGIPETWDCEASGMEFGVDYVLVALTPGNSEYDSISKEFSKAGLSVVSIERLQNFILLDRYRREREHIVDNRQKEFGINEQYLYHGTKVEKRVVCEESLDQRLSRKGHFGRGIYFSDNPRKCLQYVNSSEKTICVLKCRVILGDTKVYSKGQSDPTLKREPAKENPSSRWKFYDSVKGCPRDFNEFVIYESRRAMTEYIITCRKSPDEPASDQTADQSVVETAEGEIATKGSNTKFKWVRVPLSSPKDGDNNNAVTITTGFAENDVATVVSPATESSPAQEVVAPTTDSELQNQTNQDGRSVSSEDSDCESVTLDCESVTSDCDSVTSDCEPVNDAVADDHPDSSFVAPPVTVPFNPVQDVLPVVEDDHMERIRKVREEIRRQRQLEKSGQVSKPSEKTDMFLVDNPVGTASSVGPVPLSHLLDDPVELVRSGLVAEFLQVTMIQDVRVARYHITQADMNLDQAILDYYNSLS